MEIEKNSELSMWTALSELFMHRMDDLIYTELLCISFFFSLANRMIKYGIVREIISGLIGIAMIIYFTGWKFYYSFVIVLINLLLHVYVKNRFLPLVSFIVTFVYLGFLRICHIYGLPPLISHANAVQLILTLRLVGLSFEISDSRLKAFIKNDSDRIRFIQEPRWWQTIMYCYSFPGLFTGPYYSYAMHCDVVAIDNISKISVSQHVRWRVFNLAWSFPAFLIFVYFFPLEMMREKQFYDETMYYRIYVSVLIFFWMRCRVYSAWMVAESICVLNGIGVYPEKSAPCTGHGPTKLPEYLESLKQKDVKYNTEAVRNLDMWSIEFEPSFRGGIRSWNRSVQYWLANYVYKRVPRAVRMILTMAVSAYWHGVHPGYFLSFLTVPLCTLGEDLIMSVVPCNERGDRPLLFKILWYILRQLGFAFMASGFLLLTWTDTIRYWNSVHFYIHWIMAVIIVSVWLYKAIIYTCFTDKTLGTPRFIGGKLNGAREQKKKEKKKDD